MRNPQHGTPKRQGGISLIPELWAAIEQAAERGGVPKNRVMETILMREFGIAGDSQKTDKNDRKMRAVAGVFDE